MASTSIVSTTSATLPDQTCCLSDFVSAGVNDSLTYRNFSIVEVLDNGMEFVQHCLIDDYLDELIGLCKKVDTITKEEKLRYKYAPDLLAYDMYGYVQLDFIVMWCNGCVTPNEFTLHGDLYLPTKSTLSTFMSYVYNAESEYLSINRSEYGLD